MEALNTTVHRGLAAFAGMAILALAVVGCSDQPAVGQGDVSGARSYQAASPTAGMGISPMATPTRGVGISPMATPATGAGATPMAASTAVVPSVSQALSDIYANVQRFYGVVTLTTNPGGSNSVSMTLDQWFQRPDNMRLQVTKSSSDPTLVDSVLVYDGKMLTVYDAANNRVLEIQNQPEMVTFLNLPQEQIFPELYLFQAQQFLSSLGQNAQVTVDGQETIAGRQTTAITVTPQTSMPNLQSIKVWLDDQTQVPLRLEAMRSDGSVALNIEYSQFDPSAQVTSDKFTFTPPTGAQVIQPTPDGVAQFAGFQKVTMQEAESKAGFPILQPNNLPAGVSLQWVGASSYGNSTVVALFFGSSPQDISAVLVERSTSLEMPLLHGARSVSLNGTTGYLYEAPSMEVVEWTQGNTDLTLATSLSQAEAMQMAQSAQ